MIEEVVAQAAAHAKGLEEGNVVAIADRKPIAYEKKISIILCNEIQCLGAKLGLSSVIEFSLKLVDCLAEPRRRPRGDRLHPSPFH